MDAIDLVDQCIPIEAPFLINGKFQLGQHELRFNRFDLINAFCCHRTFLSDSVTHKAILTPSDSFGGLVATFSAALTMRLKDIYEERADLYEHLNKNDILLVEGMKCRYLGRNRERPGDIRLILMFANSTRVEIPIHRPQSVQKYHGKADTLNKYDPTRFAKAGFEESLFGFKEKVFPTRRFNRLLVVSSKDFALQMADAQIWSDGQVRQFSSYCPMAWWGPDSVQAKRIGSDASQDEPTIFFTSSLSKASDLAEQFKIASVLVVGGEGLATGISGFIKLLDFSQLKHILVILPIGNKESLETLTNNGFTYWSWTLKEIAKSLYAFPAMEDSRANRRRPDFGHHQILQNILTARVRMETVSRPQGITESSGKIRGLLADLKRLGLPQPHLDPIFAMTFSVLIGFDQLSVPYSDVVSGCREGNVDPVTRAVNFLLEKSSTIDSHASEKSPGKVLTEIVQHLQELVSSHSYQVGKSLKVSQILPSTSGRVGVVSQNRFKDLQYLAIHECATRKLCFLTPAQVEKAGLFDHLVFMGLLPNKWDHLAMVGSAKEIIGLCYDHEGPAMARFLSGTGLGKVFQGRTTLPEFLGMDAGEVTGEGGEPIPGQAAIAREPVPKPIVQLLSGPGTPSLLDIEVMFTFLEEYSRRTAPPKSDAGAAATTTEAHCVLLEDNLLFFFRKDGSLNVLDRNYERVERRKISDLAPGSEIVLLSDATRDLFEEHLEKVLSIPEHKAKLDLSSLWRESLIAYKQRRNRSVEDLRDQLEFHGADLESQTIYRWLREPEMIAPNSKALEALRKLLKDPALDAKWDEMRSAIEWRKGLHLRVGQYLGRMLAKSAVHTEIAEDEDVIDLGSDIRRTIDELRDMVSVRRIERVFADTYLVSVNKLRVPLPFEELD